MPPVVRIFMRMHGVIAVIATLIGGAVVIGGSVNIVEGRVLLEEEVATTAHVVRKYTERHRRSQGGTKTSYYIELNFGADSQIFEETTKVSRGMYNATPEGGVMTVYYLPNDPTTFELSSGKTLRAGKNTLMLGSALLVAGAFWLFMVGWRARRAAALLQSGHEVHATLYKLVNTDDDHYLRFGFMLVDGEAIEKRSFSRRAKAFEGLVRQQKIPVLYDSAAPKFAFWRGDLE